MPSGELYAPWVHNKYYLMNLKEANKWLYFPLWKSLSGNHWVDPKVGSWSKLLSIVVLPPFSFEKFTFTLVSVDSSSLVPIYNKHMKD